ncbi:hypothetical protein HYW41_04770 [Candidatus Daviesbacteria bacterium]|nr:hypothetical protein [Candidatus Daviesbacteria bacterium]
MLRTNVYLTEDQQREIKTRAAIAGKPKAEILREIISSGLKAASVQKSASTQTFLKLASIAKQFKGKGTGPKDLSINLDKYTWDE